MNWLERHCLCLEAPAAILHIGAGTGADLAAWKRFGGSRVILLEPLSDLAAQLRRMTAGQKQFTVLQAAVGPADGYARLQRYNEPLYSSLRSPTRLADLLPGLIQVADLEVETRTLASLAKQFRLRAGSNNWLVLDAPGMEMAVLDELAQWSGTPLFSRLFLSAGVEALYEEGQPANLLLARARELGYAVHGGVDRADPDWPRWHLGFDQALLKAHELEKELGTARARLEKLDEALLRAQDLESELGTARARLEKLDEASKQAQSDLSVALRMLTLRERDLKELQERYADLLGTRDTQHELLLQIRQRLSLAAEYLQQLKHESDEERKSELTSDLVRALAHGLVDEKA